MCLIIKTSMKDYKTLTGNKLTGKYVTYEQEKWFKERYIKPSTKKITCYKVLLEIRNKETGKTRYQSPYMGTKFKKREVNDASEDYIYTSTFIFKEDENTAEAWEKMHLRTKVEKGFFHTFKNFPSAKIDCDKLNNYYRQYKPNDLYFNGLKRNEELHCVVVECTIPFGTYYCEGEFMRSATCLKDGQPAIASEKLKFGKVVYTGRDYDEEIKTEEKACV